MARLWSYPGGKSRVAARLFAEMEPWLDKATAFHEPFIGGGAVAIAVAKAYPKMRIVVNDADAGIAAVWRCIASGDTSPLKRRLVTRKATVESFTEALYHFKSTDPLDLAARSIFLSKTSFSGLAVSPIGGWDPAVQRAAKWKVDCKWKPENITRELDRLTGIFGDRLRVRHTNAINYISEIDEKNVAYIDPPYYSAGQACYTQSMTPVQHAELATALSQARCKWLLSYDDHAEILGLYKWAKIDPFALTYSMAPGNKRWAPKKELLIRRR